MKRPPVWQTAIVGLAQAWAQIPLPLVGWSITLASILLCLLLSFTRFPGMELAGIAPNWLLIWVVTWSLKRNPVTGAIAGLLLGLLQDGLTSPDPTHAIGLALVGYLTARIQKQRFVQEDFISVALIVFGMAVVAETVMALQFILQGGQSLGEIWQHHQLVALSSAILSSLWAPVLYFPLNRLWEQMNQVELEKTMALPTYRSRG
jgi:rod shape-determining protein MreD